MSTHISNHITVTGKQEELDIVKQIFSCFDKPKVLNDLVAHSHLFSQKCDELESLIFSKEERQNAFFELFKDYNKETSTDDESLCAFYSLWLTWLSNAEISSDEKSIDFKLATRTYNFYDFLNLIAGIYNELEIHYHLDAFGVESKSYVWKNGELVETTTGESVASD
jgi:hypothetical protein